MNDNPSITTPPTEEHRRSFLTKLLTVVAGGIAMLVPAAAGLAVFFDPLRKRKTSGAESGADEGFLRVASLDSLPVGRPRRVVVIDDRVDAWNFFPQEPVGAVYLVRHEDDTVTALSAECPHAGCSVDFAPDRSLYQCPCHNSSFHVDGRIANENSPSARALDSLEVESRKLEQGQVWVKFQRFQSATAEKIVADA